MSDLATVQASVNDLENKISGLSEFVMSHASLAEPIIENAATLETIEVLARMISDLEIEIQSMNPSETASALAIQLSGLESRFNSLSDIISKQSSVIASQQSDTQRSIDNLEMQVAGIASADQDMRTANFQIFSAAMNGDIGLALQSGNLAEDVSKAEIEAAAGTYTKTIDVLIKTGGGSPHEWAEYEPKITAGGDHTVSVEWADSDAVDPRFSGGLLRLVVTFPDETYTPGEACTVTVDPTQTTASVGIPLCTNLNTLVKTFNVIA